MKRSHRAPRRLLSAIVILGLSSVNSLAAAIVAMPPAGVSNAIAVQAGDCLYNNRILPNGATVACMVQPHPNTPCHNLLGTVVLWTCRNGQWTMK